MEKLFRVKLRRTATYETSIDVDAINLKAARQRALDSVKNQPFEFHKAAIREQVTKVLSKS